MSLIAGKELYWAADFFKGNQSLVFDDIGYTYDQLDERSTRFSQMLLALGCRKEDRVAVLLNNSIESLDSFFGAWKAGAAYLALNARHSLKEQREIILDSDPRVVIAGHEFREIIEPLAKEFPAVRFVGAGWQSQSVDSYEEMHASASAERPKIIVSDDDIVRIHYTSGTTGKPKGIVMRHSSLRERMYSFFATYEPELNSHDTMMHVGPLTHAAGNYLIPCYMRGVRNVVLPKFTIESLMESIDKYQVTHLFLVPTMLTRFVEAAETGKYTLSSLRVVNYGVAPTPVDTQIRGIRCLGKIFRQHYGMSECSQPITVFPREAHDIESEEGLERLSSCGKLVFNVDLLLRGGDGTPVPTGEVGEITLKVERQVTAEYWRRSELQEASIRDGWFYSGDLGRFDEEGYLYIVGRNKEMIISGGFNVYAREVEDALHMHLAVREAAVFGIEDEQWGEIIVAAVVLNDGHEVHEQELIESCKQYIASYKKPKVLYFVDSLSRNNAGKIDKLKIKESFIKDYGNS